MSNAIQQRRLERAMRVLLTGTAARPPRRAIADLEEHYSRAFRARFIGEK